MKVAPAVEAEVLGVVDAVEFDMTAPRSAEMERGPAAADEEPGAGGEGTKVTPADPSSQAPTQQQTMTITIPPGAAPGTSLRVMTPSGQPIDIVVPPAAFVVGRRVEARWAGGREWYPGKITAVRDGGAYKIRYDDGADEDGVAEGLIRDLEGTQLRVPVPVRQPAAAPAAPYSQAPTQQQTNATQLFVACEKGNVELARFLLDNGAAVDRANKNGQTPLYTACVKGHVDAARLLLERGAAVDQANKNGATPLWISCWKGHVDAARLLLERGAEVDRADKDDWTPLHIACDNGHLDAVRLLLGNGAAVDRATGDGRTPLYIACCWGYVDAARLLLEKGAAVDRALEDGATPLHVACLNGHVEAALLLLDKGADVNRANENGMTPLYLARRNNHVGVVGLLLEKGAGGARGSVEYLGLWREPKRARNAVKMEGEGENVRIPTRIAFGRFVDALVKNKVPGGTFGIAQWTEWRGGNKSKNQPPTQVTVWRVYWSTKPGDTSYQRHGFAGMSSPTPERIVPFADFEPIAETLGGKNQIALYRVTLPREGLDPDKWAGRPPPPAPADLWLGPRRDGLLSTEDIRGEYFSSCFPFYCSSVTVTPIGADVIEMKQRGWSMFLSFWPCMPICTNDIKTRERRTNAFGTWQKDGYRTVFNGDGSMKNEDCICCDDRWYRRRSKGRPFRKVETKDIAGTWCHYRMCLLPVPVWLCVSYTGVFSTFSCSSKTRLNEDQYEEVGCCCCSLLPLLPLCCSSETRTRHYVKGHPTNWFDHHQGEGFDVLGSIYRDSGCVDGAIMGSPADCDGAIPTMSFDCGWKCCSQCC